MNLHTANNKFWETNNEFAEGGAIKDYVTPEMFGAIGNGLINDLSAFNDAISNMSDGDVLYIPNGKYLLNDTLTINKNITIFCDGTLYVDHSNPVILFDELSNVQININTIQKNTRMFDYEEGTIEYSIGAILKNCTGVELNVNNILNTTTAIVLVATDNKGCQYNSVSCNNAMTFAGVELIRSSSGGWVNGNTINHFRWMINTWSNSNLLAAYMIKSLSYVASGESEPYKNNGNVFYGLSAEYGEQAAEYPILLVRLDYAKGYEFKFDRVEILAKNSSLNSNMFYFTNSIFCTGTINFILASGYTMSIGDLATEHNVIYIKENYEKLKQNEVVDILSDITLHESLSYTNYWFYAVKNPLTKSVKIVGELIVSANIANNTAIISNVPKCRLGYGTMKIQMGTTATMWQEPANVTYYKLNIGGNATEIHNIGAIPSGVRLYVDFEYFAADSEFN